MPDSLLREPVRRLAAWCAVVLLATAVLAVGVWLCTVPRTVVTPVLPAVPGTALLGPMHRRLVGMGVNRLRRGGAGAATGGPRLTDSA